jgi:hypothetical protein
MTKLYPVKTRNAPDERPPVVPFTDDVTFAAKTHDLAKRIPSAKRKARLHPAEP